jgi:hypothetical protein
MFPGVNFQVFLLEVVVLAGELVRVTPRAVSSWLYVGHDVPLLFLNGSSRVHEVGTL